MAKLSNREITDHNISSEDIGTLVSEYCYCLTLMKRRVSFTEQPVLPPSTGKFSLATRANQT
jgi:hypothetical protein